MGMGSFSEVKNLDVRTVLQRFKFEAYKVDYDATYVELNKK